MPEVTVEGVPIVIMLCLVGRAGDGMFHNRSWFSLGFREACQESEKKNKTLTTTYPSTLPAWLFIHTVPGLQFYVSTSCITRSRPFTCFAPPPVACLVVSAAL